MRSSYEANNGVSQLHITNQLGAIPTLHNNDGMARKEKRHIRPPLIQWAEKTFANISLGTLLRGLNVCPICCTGQLLFRALDY